MRGPSRTSIMAGHRSGARRRTHVRWRVRSLAGADSRDSRRRGERSGGRGRSGCSALRTAHPLCARGAPMVVGYPGDDLLVVTAREYRRIPTTRNAPSGDRRPRRNGVHVEADERIPTAAPPSSGRTGLTGRRQRNPAAPTGADGAVARWDPDIGAGRRHQTEFDPVLRGGDAALADVRPAPDRCVEVASATRAHMCIDETAGRRGRHERRQGLVAFAETDYC
jgi:hypothetical protein